MIYFNGFSLKAEEVLFQDFMIENDTCVVGFSYGAQKAVEYVYHTTERVDRLILLSPAFFNTEKSSFIRTQLHYFETQQKAYVSQFLENIAYPVSLDLTKYISIGTKDELSSLLNYRWDKEKIEKILGRGTQIEVFIGSDDKIIDTQAAKDFFSQTTIYLLKDRGHILKKDA